LNVDGGGFGGPRDFRISPNERVGVLKWAPLAASGDYSPGARPAPAGNDRSGSITVTLAPLSRDDEASVTW
jgi:hypothetical protein